MSVDPAADRLEPPRFDADIEVICRIDQQLFVSVKYDPEDSSGCEVFRKEPENEQFQALAIGCGQIWDRLRVHGAGNLVSGRTTRSIAFQR